jgi:hypothetical protein
MVSLPSFTVSASSGALARTHSLRAIARWCSELGVQPPLIEVANPAASLSAVGASPLLVAAPYFGEILSAPPFETVSDASSFSSWIAVALPNALALVPITLLGSDSEIQQQCHACRLACTTFNSQHLSTQFFQPDESAPPTTPPTWWHTLSLKDATCQELLRCLLNSSAEFTNYSARVGSSACSSLDDVPTKLRTSRDSAARNHQWRSEPFSEVLVPPRTAPLPPVVKAPSVAWKPQGVADILLPNALAALQSWLSANAKDIEWMRSHEEGADRPFKPPPLILGQSSMVEQARGVVWDLRVPNDIKPLDPSSPITSDLNIPFLKVLMTSCEDQELRDHVVRGAHFKADVPLQTVLLPHMNSLMGRVDLVEKEIERLRNLEWHQASVNPPFLPCRILPNGSVARKLEPTTNASAPHSLLIDEDGVIATSLNAAIKGPNVPNTPFVEPMVCTPATPSTIYRPPGVAVQGRQRPRSSRDATSSHAKWPKELKPTVLDKCHDIGVLQYAAQVVFKEEMVGFVTDWRDYFSQFAVFPGDLWLNVVHWSNLEGLESSDYGCFVSEQRLGFGASSSSNIGQRFAHFIAEVFRRAFDREEEEIFAQEDDPIRVEYLSERRSLGAGQCRLYEISIYTDDPFFVCVGPDRLLRGLRLWHRLMRAVGLLSAIPAKWQCGNKLRWLGLDWMLGIGALLIPANKRLRALSALRTIAAGETMTFDEYRGVTSFLQYLRPFVLGIDKSLLYGFYGPFQKDVFGLLPTTTSMVTMTPMIREQSARWISILRATSGTTFSSVLAPTSFTPSKPVVYLYSDAALEGAAVPGLGGFLDGFWWSIPLHGDALKLPISVLEFVAIGVNIIIFAKLVVGAHAFICSDSLNSVQVLNSFSAKSELMQFVHTKILALPESKDISDSSSVLHCRGAANPAADHLSRGETEKFKAFCAHLGIVPVEMTIPVEASNLLLETVEFASSNGLLKECRSSNDLQRERRFGKRFSSDSTGDGPNTATSTPRQNRVHLLETFSAARPRGTDSRTGRHVRLSRSLDDTLPSHDNTESFLASARPHEIVSDTARAPLPRKSIFAASTATVSKIHQPPLAMAQGSSPQLTTENPFAPARHRKRCAASLEDTRTTGSDTTSTLPSRKRVFATSVVVAPDNPRPLSARTLTPAATSIADARRAWRLTAANERVHTLADWLANDPSPLALRPQNPETLLRLCSAVMRATESVPSPATLRADDLAWDRWTTYCSSLGTSPVRSDILANAGLDYLGTQRETIALCGFMMHCAETMTGRGGKGKAKPGTIHQQVLAIRRIHDRMGAPMGVLPGVRKVFVALVKSYVAQHGPDALMPKRKEPLDTHRIGKILNLANGTKLGTMRLDWTSPFFIVFKAVLCTGFAAAFRKAELLPVGRTEERPSCLTRASVSWIIAGAGVSQPTDAQLRALTTGDFCVIKPPECKNDTFGLHFGWKPIWLPFARVPTNAAAAIAAVLLAVPVERALSTTTPLFCIAADGSPFRQADADRLLSHALKAAFPSENSSRWSMHSLRIGAACALLKANASYELIQAMCRWRSVKSLELYARLGPTDYGRWVIKASQQRTDSVTARNLPRIDYDGVVGILGGMADDLEV